MAYGVRKVNVNLIQNYIVRKKKTMKTAVTGHRPNKLGWSYDYNESHWTKLKEIFKNELIRLQTTDAYCGMALGVDTVFALAVIELKQAGHAIKLHACIPCNNQCNKWAEQSKQLYYQLLTNSDEIIGMSEANGYEELALYSIKNNITNKNDYILLKKCCIENIDFTTTPLSEHMIYNQIYKPYLMQKRNQYMVDKANNLIAVWDGTSGGTGNCIKYAQSQSNNCNIIHIKPCDI